MNQTHQKSAFAAVAMAGKKSASKVKNAPTQNRAILEDAQKMNIAQDTDMVTVKETILETNLVDDMVQEAQGVASTMQTIQNALDICADDADILMIDDAAFIEPQAAGISAQNASASQIMSYEFAFNPMTHMSSMMDKFYQKSQHMMGNIQETSEQMMQNVSNLKQETNDNLQGISSAYMEMTSKMMVSPFSVPDMIACQQECFSQMQQSCKNMMALWGKTSYSMFYENALLWRSRL